MKYSINQAFTWMVFLTLLLSCAPMHYFSNVKQGFQDFPPTPIDVSQAIRLAQPFLDESYKMRLSLRKWPLETSQTPLVYVSLVNDYYYIVKEDYPYKFREAYLEFAVRIHKETGEVTLIRAARDF